MRKHYISCLHALVNLTVFFLNPDIDIDPEHRSYVDHYSPHAIGRNHIKVYRGKSIPVKGHDDYYGGDNYFSAWGYHANLTPDSKYGVYHWFIYIDYVVCFNTNNFILLIFIISLFTAFYLVIIYVVYV